MPQLAAARCRHGMDFGSSALERPPSQRDHERWSRDPCRHGIDLETVAVRLVAADRGPDPEPASAAAGPERAGDPRDAWNSAPRAGVARAGTTNRLKESQPS
jgi:hypothetical protein